MSHAYSVKQSEEICKTLNALRLGNFLSDVYLEHVKTLTRSVFMLGYKGKVVNAEVFSEKHRTTVAHFLNNGRWDSLHFEKALKRQVIDRIYEEARKSGAPIFCIVEALFKKFCKRDFCDEVRDFKIPEPEAVAS